MRKLILTPIILLTLVIFLEFPTQAATQKLGPCKAGKLSTSTRKIFQMTYQSEDFQQLTNVDLLKDVSQLKDLTCLQYLDATDRNITGDITNNLTNLKNLEVFSLYSTPDVSGDICSLAGATKLRSLKMAFDPKITGDISCLKNLTNLETLAVTQTNLTGDISVFANMPNLKALYLSGTRVKGDVCSLKNLTNLQELGLADEYPGNPDIYGNLGCLDNLKKLTRVSIYNTKTTNCEQFTKSHPNMDKKVTESGKQGGGGCSKESMKTLVDYAQKYERKIGTEVQTEVRGQPNYNEQLSPNAKYNPGKGDFKPGVFEMIRSFLSRLPVIGRFFGAPVEFGAEGPGQGQGGLPPGGVGPGGCKSRQECEAYCSEKENFETCSQFAPSTSR